MFLLRWRRYPRRGAGGHGWSYRAVALLGAGIVAVASPAAAPKTGTQHPAQAGASGTEVYAWGNNANGQLGTGTAGGPAPQQVTGLQTDITAIAAGWTHSLAAGSDGHVYAWGNNADGRLGTGPGTVGGTYPAPQQVTALSARITAVSAGDRHSLALTSDGRVYAWGYNGSGRLGTGPGTVGGTYPEPQPVTAGLPARVTAVSVGFVHSLAVGSDGHVYAWGSNAEGRLGITPAGGTYPTPQQVTGLPDDITAVAAGGSHSLALTSDGRVYAWGYNTSGEVGNGNTDSPVTTPQQVTGLPDDIAAIAADGFHSLALTSDGRVYAWGANSSGQGGTGAVTATEPTPQQVTVLPPDITAIAAGYTHSLALASDGRVYAWGYNGSGQVGTGATSGPVPTPQQVTTLPAGITAIAAGYDYSLAVAGEAPVPTSTQLTAVPAEQQHGLPVTLTAEVSCPGRSPSGTVEFFADGISVGTADLTGQTAELTVTTLTEGSHAITAVYSGSTDCAASESGTVTVTITPAVPPVTGVLSVTVPDTASLGTTPAGGTVSGQLGTVTVADDRTTGAGSWRVEVSATNFTSVPPAAAYTIDASAGTYAPGTVTVTPGTISTATATITLSGDAQTVVTATGSGANTAQWDPAVSVTVPAEAEPGTYTGTISTSVSG